MKTSTVEGYFTDTGYTKKLSCHVNHKPLAVGSYKITGASCVQPRDGYDIYIGFDYGMSRSKKAFPWHAKTVEVYFPIPDGDAPSNAAEFDKMIAWTIEQLAEGKKIHVGCIGGHGRTGVFLAALVKVVTGNADAINYVRKNYCAKAVETEEQISFLVKHYGIQHQVATKKKYIPSPWVAEKMSKYEGPKEKASMLAGTQDIYPVKSIKSIWNRKIVDKAR